MGIVSILGAEYRAEVMPDGKEWTTTNAVYLADGIGCGWDGGTIDWGGAYYTHAERIAVDALLSDGWRVMTEADGRGLITSVEALVGPENSRGWAEAAPFSLLFAGGRDSEGTWIARTGTPEYRYGIIAGLAAEPATEFTLSIIGAHFALYWAVNTPEAVGPGFETTAFPIRFVREVTPPPLAQSPLEADYTSQLQELLPKGWAWTRRTGTNLWVLFSACAKELARVHTREQALLRELTPSKTQEGLEDWEEELGIPEPGGVLRITTEDRRAEVARKFQALGGCSATYFESQAALLGYPTTVNELYRGAAPFKAGTSAAGGALTQGRYLFTWEMVVHGVPGPDTFLETTIRRIAPKHTLVLFTYD